MGERLTQTGIESVVAGTPRARLTRSAIESIVAGAPHVRLTQAAIEVVIPNKQPISPTAFITGPIFPVVKGLSFPVLKAGEFATTLSASKSFSAVTVQNSINPFWHWTLVYDYVSNNANRDLATYSPWTDYQILQGFYGEVGGMAQPFLLTDPGTALGSPDNYVGPALLNLPWQANRVYIPGAVIVDPNSHAQKATVVNGPTGWAAPMFSTSGGTVVDNGNVTWQDLGLASGTQPNPNAQLQLLTDGRFWYSPLQRNFGGMFLEDITDLNQNPAIGGSTLEVYINGLEFQSAPAAYQILGPGLRLANQPVFYGAYLRFYPWRSFVNYFIGGLLIDSGGHLQKSLSVGPTGVLEPNWNHSGGTTLDGGILWQDLGAATTITASFNFFFRVRFETDELDFEQFLSDVFTIGGPDAKNGAGYLKLMTARPGVPIDKCAGPAF